MNPVNIHSRDNMRESVVSTECPDCASTDVSIEYRDQAFKYGSGTDAVQLTSQVPVYRCNSCRYQWTGAEGEDARHRAICEHLGRLTPDEVLRVREHPHLSQAEFSRITGFGEASLSRWETGVQIQNASSDRLLRLIQADPENLRRLKEWANPSRQTGTPKFRVITITPEIRQRKESFHLRRRAG
jgi:putative zinc finger/helix-turn-helix YgiT family protein